MGIFSRQSTPQITREQAMNAKPIRHPELEATRAVNGEVSIKIPRRKTWWLNLLAKMGGFPEYRILTLDRVGSWVWDLCDGQHTVKELVARLAEEHQLSRKEAEVSMVTYLRQLVQRNLVALAIEKNVKDEAAETGADASADPQEKGQ